MTIRCAINGFGRIGRNFFRAAFRDPEIEIIAINDLTDAHTLAHLLLYDSIHGLFNAHVTAGDGKLHVEGRAVQVFNQKDPAALPWKELGIDLVVESTGVFTGRKEVGRHCQAGARKVVISAPAPDPDVTIVLGVNEEQYDPRAHAIISNASCTTNCLAPIVKILSREFGFQKGLMTTIHSYTNDQSLLDLPHRDLRRARAAGLSMIPTTTGAARAVGAVLPAVKGKIEGMAIRVPTPNVSIVDLVAEVEREVTEGVVNTALRRAAEGEMKGILRYSEEPLVSVDLNGDPHSAIVDAPLTRVVRGRMVKVLAWYDNEWGYSCRIRDLIRYIARRGL